MPPASSRASTRRRRRRCRIGRRCAGMAVTPRRSNSATKRLSPAARQAMRLPSRLPRSRPTPTPRVDRHRAGGDQKLQGALGCSCFAFSKPFNRMEDRQASACNASVLVHQRRLRCASPAWSTHSAQGDRKDFTPIEAQEELALGCGTAVGVSGVPSGQKDPPRVGPGQAEGGVAGRVPRSWNGGILTTAGDIVVQAALTQRREALVVRRANRCDGGPVSYEVDGEQPPRVVVGGALRSLEAGKLAAKSNLIRNVSRVLAFKVGKREPSATSGRSSCSIRRPAADSATSPTARIRSPLLLALSPGRPRWGVASFGPARASSY